MKTKLQKKSSGFTLVELLVVIAIIAVLLAVLMPALGKVKWQSKVNACRNNLKQWGMACLLYTGDYGGAYPSYRLPCGVGGNPWDVSYQFVDDMRNKYNLPIKMFYCPAAEANPNLRSAVAAYPGNDREAFWDMYWFSLQAAIQSDRTLATMKTTDLSNTPCLAEMRYAFWIPRQCANGWFPNPGATWSSSPPTKYVAPMRDSDKTRSVYPIMTDVCRSNGDITGSSLPISELIKTITQVSHTRNNQVDSINSLYGDGHVESNKLEQIAPRFPAWGLTHWW
jgi:prepilin-type N-terminal cleavage/methylation domain-containing protein